MKETDTEDAATKLNKQKQANKRTDQEKILNNFAIAMMKHHDQ